MSKTDRRVAVKVPHSPKRADSKSPAFDAQTFLDSAGVARRGKEVKKAEVVYSQGDAAKSVMYLQEGGVQLSVVSESGKEAGVAPLGGGGFLLGRVLAGPS